MGVKESRTKKAAQLCQTLRDMGCAVSCFMPEELGEADPDLVEDIMVERGWDAIASLQPAKE